MKKALLLILAMCLILTSCGQSAQAPMTEAEEVMTTAEPEVLEKIWESYIDDCPFTIASSVSSWESPGEIEPLALCNYLFLKMQRNEDTEDTNFAEIVNTPGKDLWIKADKLNAYQKKYFAEELDFRNVESAGCYYDEEKDAVVLSVAYLWAQLPEVKYNEFDSYPHFALESLTVDKKEKTAFAQIAVHDYRLPIPSPENKLICTMTFKMSEDESLLIDSFKVDIPPLKGSGVKGEKEILPAMSELDKFTTTGPFGDTLPLFAYHPDGLLVSSCNIKTGEYRESQIIPLRSEHSESSIILRNGHLLLIETTFNISEDGSINTNEPGVYLSEIFLDGKERQEFALPEDCSYISDVSPDLSRMLYKKSMDGDFIVYDFNKKSSQVIPNTAPAIDTFNETEEILSMEAFGHGSFTGDSSMVVLYKFGYEWGAGYSIYDIATGAISDHPVRTNFGGYPIMTPNGLYIGGISDEGGSSYRHGFLKFNEGEIQTLPATPFPENFQYAYVPNGESRFIAMLMPTNDEEYYNPPETGLTEMAVVIFDSQSLTIKDTGARLMRTPQTQCFIFMLEDNSVYIFDPNISRENAYIIANPFI